MRAPLALPAQSAGCPESVEGGRVRKGVGGGEEDEEQNGKESDKSR